MPSIDVTTLLTALFGGAGATLLWELVLKPRRERRALAEVLAAEVSLNFQIMAAALVAADPRKVPPDFRASTMVFDAVAERIGELPSQDVAEVVLLYNHFANLNRTTEFYMRSVDEYRATPSDSPHRNTVEAEIQSCIRVFYGSLDKAVNRANIAQPRLLRAARPWWSMRRWSMPKTSELSLEEIAKRIHLSDQHRDAAMAAIKRVRDAHGKGAA